MTATFDYKGFAKDLTKQAESVMPEDIALKHKKEFLDRIYDFTYIAGEAFSNDDTIEDSETAKVLTQMISEWTFHKYVDLLRSDIPDMYHESILQKVAYVAFEMGKESEFSKLTQEQMLTLVEQHTKKAYDKAQELKVRTHVGNILSSDIFYNDRPEVWKNWARMGVMAVEMETYALYSIAASLHKKALTILTISDSFIVSEETTAEQREKSFTDMMKIALEIAE